MAHMPNAWLAAPVVLAAVLLASGLAKRGRDRETLQAMRSLRLGPLARSWIAAALPWGELVLAVALLLAPGVLGGLAALAALALFAAYWIVIARALALPEPVDCHCFGALGAARVTRMTLVRNTLLVVLAGVGAVGAFVTPGVLPGLLGLGAEAWWLVALAVAAVLVLVTLREQPAAAAADEPTIDGEPLDYERQPIPYGVTIDRRGTSATLGDLAASRARLLLFVNAGCGSCGPVIERIDAWTAALPQLGVHPVTRIAVDELAALVPGSADAILTDPEGNCGRALNVHGTPSAVVLGVDGLLAGGPVWGPEAVTDFVGDIQEQLAEAAAE